MSNPIVEALRAALTEAEGKSNKYGAGPHYLYAWECLHIAIEGAIPVVESLVAENARLTAEAPEAITEATEVELRVIAGALWHDRRGWRERALAAVRAIEQERSRYEGLLAGLRDRFLANASEEREIAARQDWRECHAQGRMTAYEGAANWVTAALTPSAPATFTSVWLVEKDERSRTGQHLWSMWHLDGHVEWTPDANLADQYEAQAEAGMAALRITESKGSPCHATEHVFIEGPDTPSAPAEKEG